MTAISTRLPEPTIDRLRSRAREEDRTVSEIVCRAVEEYLRSGQFPGITFVPSGSGRRKAKLTAGPAVWSVVWTVRNRGGDLAQAAEHLRISVADVRLALAYHQAYPDDTEERIERINRADEAPEAIYPSVAVLTVT